MSSNSRDDFTEQTKRTLAARVSNKCSNPDCNSQTSGPQEDNTKSVNIGVAAHITSAASGGARYNSSLSPEERSDISNGIWLCQNCAKLVDNDLNRFDVDTLQTWKDKAENSAEALLGKTSINSEVEIIDKWINMPYIEKSGIGDSFRKNGYKLYWAGANKESEFIDLKGYEFALIEQSNGSQLRFKIKNNSVGGYLVLLKKLTNSV